MSKTDGRLSFKPYREVLERVQIQFELIRFSLKVLKQKQRRQFFKEIAEDKIARNEEFRTSVKQHHLIPDEQADQIASDAIKRIRSELRRENRVGHLYALSEFTDDRVNQSELLLLVAHFEAFMKLVHERFLIAAPNKVFGKGFRGKQNPEIPLKDIFDSTQSSWNTEKFLKELVAKEVKWLDGQNIKAKAEYFREHFGISFGFPKDIEDLTSIMRRRNRISHEIYEPPKTHDEMLKATLEQGKEQPLVDGPILGKARQFFFWIPHQCIGHGAKTYQSHFKSY